MAHPIAAVIQDGVKPPKGAFRAYMAARMAFIVADEDEIEGLDLAGTLAVVMNGQLFNYDPLDVSTAHDGATTLVSLDGRRYKKVGGSTSASDLTSGTLDIARIADRTITEVKLAKGAAAANVMQTVVSGVGTIERTIDANIRAQNFNVLNYGAVAGGDLLVPLQKAIDAANTAGGGTVFIPAGPWTLSGAITMYGNILVRGAGRGATTITCTSATAHMFSSTSKNMMAFLDMTLDNSATKTAGSAFYFDTCSVVAIRNVQIANHIFPIEEIGSVSIWFDEIEISGLKASTGIGIIIDGGNDHYLRNVFIKTASIAGQALAGINIKATGGTWLTGCGTLWCNDGLLINPGAGKVVEHIFSALNAYDTGTGHGIKLAPVSTGVIRRCRFVEDWAATNSENGVTIDKGSGTIDTITFVALYSVNNQKHGVSLLSGVNVRFFEPYCSGNGGAASNTYDGIFVANSVTDFAVMGGQCGASAGFSNIQRWGINVSGSSCDRYLLIGNDCRNNVTGGHQDAGATTGKQCFGNLPVSASDRLRVGGVNFVLPPAAGWQIDSDASSFTVASGAEVTLTTGSGELTLTEASSGSTAKYLLGGGSVALLGQTVGTNWATGSSPSSSQQSVYFTGTEYRIKNGRASTITVWGFTAKTRPAN